MCVCTMQTRSLHHDKKAKYKTDTEDFKWRDKERINKWFETMVAYLSAKTDHLFKIEELNISKTLLKKHEEKIKQECHPDNWRS